MKWKMLFSLLVAVLFVAASTSDAAAWRGRNNPPGPRGGPGTDWKNPPGPAGGPGASPKRHGPRPGKERFCEKHPHHKRCR